MQHHRHRGRDRFDLGISQIPQMEGGGRSLGQAMFFTTLLRFVRLVRLTRIVKVFRALAIQRALMGGLRKWGGDPYWGPYTYTRILLFKDSIRGPLFS